MADYNTEQDGAYAQPTYADVDQQPASNPHCADEDSNPNEFFNDPALIGGAGREAEVTAGNRIAVDDLSTSAKDIFRVNYVEYTALTVSLLAKPFISDVQQAEPILRGSTVDKIVLDWSYNKVIVNQALTNNGGLTPPTLGVNDITYEYTGLTITDNTQFTIQGDDGEVQPGSIQQDSDSVTFGNYRIWGDDLNAAGISSAAMQTLLDGLSNEVSTSRSKTVNATGGSNRHFFYAYPKSYGLATFKKGIFEGGFIRLKLVSGNFKLTLDGGDVEQDFIYDNGNGYTEAYYVYMSTFDNQNDPVTPIVIS